MGRVVRGLQAWRESWRCLTYLIENTRGATVIGILGFILGLTAIVFMGLVIGSVVRGSVVSVASVVSDYYAVLIALMAMLAVLMIAYLTAFITGFRGLANALPALVEELRGGAQPEVEVPPCLVEYFGGRATEVLSRLYSRLLTNTSVAMYFLVFAIADLVLLLVIGPPSSLKEPLLTEAPAVLRTSVDVALGILGVIITVVLLPRLLLIGRDAINAEVLRVVHGVRFRSLMWFSIAITLVIVSMMLPPIISIVFIAPMILAITISLTTYLTLATTVIEHIQLPRDNQGG